MAIETYLVGGAVRDMLLNRQCQDRDWVVVGATPQYMLDNGFKPILAREFPIFIKDGEEYALARKERKAGNGYKGFEVFTSPDVTLEQDLLRRDVTVNSIAYNPEYSRDGLIDPYNGMRDLKDRILRHTSNAFNEDPVRILRVARLMAQLGDYNFTVADETMQLMIDMINNGEADHLTPERVWKEMEKALESCHPERFFETLHACGALERLMPELYNLIDIPQPEKHHPEICVFQHILLSLKQATVLGDRNPEINFAVLVHDLGKAVSPKETLPAHHNHEKAGLPLVASFCDRFKVPSAYRSFAIKVTEFHLKSHKAMTMRPSKIVDLLYDLGALKKESGNVLEQYLIACESDARGRLGLSERDYPQANYIRKIYEAVTAMDTKPVIDKYQGQGIVIGQQIRNARIEAAYKATRQFKNELGADQDEIELSM